jgi:hypothetical protein
MASTMNDIILSMPQFYLVGVTPGQFRMPARIA